LKNEQAYLDGYPFIPILNSWRLPDRITKPNGESGLIEIRIGYAEGEKSYFIDIDS
jgi:hypothetical protein